MAQKTYLYGYGNGPWGSSGTRRTREYILAQPKFAKLDPEFMRRLFSLADDVIARGSDFGFGGGWRSSTEQLNLFLSRYNKVSSGTTGAFYWSGLPSWTAHAGYYVKKAGVASAAPPGRSYHESTTKNGLALAADMIGDHALANKIEHLHGLRDFANVNSEPWHYQPIEIANSRSNYKGPEPLPLFSLPGQPPPIITPPEGTTMSTFTGHDPIRILDTRKTGKPGDNSRTVVSPHGYTPKPTSGKPVYAVVMITAFEASAPGYLTLWSGSTVNPPEASNVNYGPTDPSPKNSLAVVPLAADGSFSVYTTRSVQVAIDQIGFFS
jgi:hypothetical protein